MAIKTSYFKKGVVFSLIALLISTLFLIIFSVFMHVPLNQKALVEMQGVKRAENFLNVFPSYLGTAIEYSSYQVLNFIIEESPVEDFSDIFISCMLHGNYTEGGILKNCSYINFEDAYNNTLTNNLDEIFYLASKIYRGTGSVHINKLNVIQISPYELLVDVDVLMFFKVGEKIQWERNFKVSKTVNIIGLKDPLTKTYLNRSIKVVDEYFTISEINGNLSLFEDILKNNYTFIDTFAPSFVDVLEGKIRDGQFDSSKNLGINSFMPEKLYNGSNSYKINTSMISWDYVSLKKYNMTDLYLINYSDLPSLDLTYFLYDLNVRMNISFSDLLNSFSYPCRCDENGCSC